jgi:hypothetical protein
MARLWQDNAGIVYIPLEDMPSHFRFAYLIEFDSHTYLDGHMLVSVDDLEKWHEANLPDDPEVLPDVRHIQKCISDGKVKVRR